MKVTDVNVVTKRSSRIWSLVLLVPIASSAWACGWLDEPGTGDGSGPEPEVPDPEPPPEVPTEQPFEGPCVPDAWTSPGVDAGMPTTLALQGSQVLVDGSDPEVSEIAAPLSLELSPNGTQPLVAFDNAVIDDGATAGLVVVVGGSIAADQGTFGDAGTLSPRFEPGGVALDLPLGFDDGTRPSLGPTADPEHQAALDVAAPIDIAVEALRISGYDAAYVVTETGTTQLAGPFSVTADRFYWPTSSTAVADSIQARYIGEVFIGLEPATGEASTEHGSLRALPAAIMGRDAHIVVGSDHLETIDPMPIQQAIDRDGALIPSTVELRACVPEILYFDPGATRALRFAYRQPNGLSDAVFEDVMVQADAGTDTWSARIELDPTLPAKLTDAAQEHPDYSWGQLLVDYIDFWVNFTEVFVDGLTCIFTLGFVCDDDSSSSPPPLDDYPAWMIAGDVGEFELELQAPQDPGEYEATVRIVGQNYETTVPITVVVRGAQ